MFQIVLLVFTAVVLVIIGLMLQRVVKGPTIYDRMNAVGVIGADAILLVMIFGFLDKRPDMYVDIAIAYAILGFVGTVVIAKFLGGKKL